MISLAKTKPHPSDAYFRFYLVKFRFPRKVRGEKVKGVFECLLTQKATIYACKI